MLKTSLTFAILIAIELTVGCVTDPGVTALSAGQAIITMRHADDGPDERRDWYEFRRSLFRKDCASGYDSACRRIREIDLEERDYFRQTESDMLTH